MGTFNDLLIEIGIDTTKAKKELNKLDKLFDSVGKSFKESISQGNKNTKLLPFDSKQFKSETQAIINQLKKAGQEVKQFQNKLNATKSPAKLKTLRKELELQLKGLTKFEDATNQERIKDHHLAEKKKTLFTKQEVEKRKALLAERMDRKKERAEVHSKRQSKVNLDKALRSEESQLAQKSLNDRLKHFKAEKKVRLDAELKVAEIRSKIESDRRKQAVGGLTSTTGKSAKESSGVFAKIFAERDAELKAIKDVAEQERKLAQEKQLRDRKLFIDRQKRLAQLRQQRAKESEKEALLAQKDLQNRLAAYKKSKKTEQATSTNTHKVRMSEEDRLQARQEKRINTIRRLESRLENSVNFRALKPDQQAEFKERFKEQSKRFLKSGDTTELSNGFRTLSTDIKEFKRQMIGLQTVQSGVADSTRNMIRSYASLFAMIEGTQAIERVGMDFQGMEVSMLASAESSKKAAKDLQYVNGIADEMGVNLKDATDAYVKLQFAAKGKMDDSQIKELFTNVNRFATSLKITPEQLKNSQRALQQMLNKGVLMAEEVFFASFR